MKTTEQQAQTVSRAANRGCCIHARIGESISTGKDLISTIFELPSHAETVRQHKKATGQR